MKHARAHCEQLPERRHPASCACGWLAIAAATAQHSTAVCSVLCALPVHCSVLCGCVCVLRPAAALTYIETQTTKQAAGLT
eukprot:COSAG01_NODE_13703_length_1546_cov_2.719419_1_plen_80_part_10